MQGSGEARLRVFLCACVFWTVEDLQCKHPYNRSERTEASECRTYHHMLGHDSFNEPRCLNQAPAEIWTFVCRSLTVNPTEVTCRERCLIYNFDIFDLETAVRGLTFSSGSRPVCVTACPLLSLCSFLSMVWGAVYPEWPSLHILPSSSPLFVHLFCLYFVSCVLFILQGSVCFTQWGGNFEKTCC